MPRKPWATDDQTAFLESYVERFRECKSSDRKTFTWFWDMVNDAWLERWPEHAELFPDVPKSSYTEEQRQVVQKAIDMRISQIQNWFRWRSNPASKARRRTTSSLLQHVQKSKKKRVLKPYEMYAKLHYNEKIRPRVNQVLKAEERTPGCRLQLINQISKKLYDEEDPSVKEAVLRMIEDSKRTNDGNDDDDDETEGRTPELYLRAIEELPQLVSDSLVALASLTGWSFTVLMGGPHPLAGGEITVMSLHSTGIEAKENFAEVYPSFAKVLGDPFTEYLTRLYPAEVIASRSLFPAESSDVPQPVSSDAPSVSSAHKQSKGKTKGQKGAAKGRKALIEKLLSKVVEPEQSTSSGDHGADGATAMSTTANDHSTTANDVETGNQGATIDATSSAGAYSTVTSMNSNRAGSMSCITTGPLPGVAPDITATPSTENGDGAGPGIYGVAPDITATPSTENGDGAGPGIYGVAPDVSATPSTANGNGAGPGIATPSTASSDGAGHGIYGGALLGAPTIPSTAASINGNEAGTWVYGGASTVSATPTVFAGNLCGMSEHDIMKTLSSAETPTNSEIAEGESFLDYLNSDDFDMSLLTVPSDYQPGPHVDPAWGGGMGLFGTSNLASQQTSASSWPVNNSDFLPTTNASNWLQSASGYAALPMLPDRNASALLENVSSIRSTLPDDNVSVGHVPLNADASPALPSKTAPATNAADCGPSKPMQVAQHPAAHLSQVHIPSVVPLSIPAAPLNQVHVPLPSANSVAPLISDGDLSISAADQTSEDLTNRSKRKIIPSTRLDQMNSIGSDQVKKASVGKENIPPNEPPSWFITAKNNMLLSEGLGEDWIECVTLWFEVESKLGFGIAPGTKGALPEVNLRPEEWSKFVQKGRNGARNYEAQPTISDSAEFGIAFVKWWHAIQPEQRRSATSQMPLCIYEIPASSWRSLLRAGPNGFVSLMTLATWWGRSILTRTPYQDDSSNDWALFTQDLKKTLAAMLRAIPDVASKRKLPEQEAGYSKKSSKRART